MSRPLPVAAILGAVLALGAAAPALADSAASSNWAGYAVHRAGVRFTKVVGSWKQPSASCVAGHPTYSATWVGLGGYNLNSPALEQIGTEVDCTAAGKVSSSAWYELVPAASQPISLRVRPGDTVVATVTVVGKRVVVSLYDVTSHQLFQKTLRASLIDVSSAEWIVEAPSECTSASSCQALPLADFRSATFALAQATATSGHAGTILDPNWDLTKIQLTPGGRRFVAYTGSGVAVGSATPSSLSATGGSFKVTFANIAVQANALRARPPASLQAGYLVHARR